jgi:pre-rRNA-processing protein TSR4
MVSYDSDDDDFEAQDYTETDVLLGYASNEDNGETISRLGGRPVSPFFLLCPRPQIMH